jgi:CDP-glycerol glycerophosphotransferase (TagB/SpsB family)/glycosyltransferase involved in cell wall biosynthesis
MSSKKYPCKFSIVTAVYNTEDYVSDAIDSVINQSIGFKDNVQLILVNDGSTDKSGEICKEYRDKYPNNIVYIEKENGGVSSARNRGLRKVKGKYVNFLDSDDKLSKNTLKEVWKFFEKHYDEIDFVSIPTKFFGASTTEHQLNYKYDKKGVFNILENPSYILFFINSAFIKHDIARKYKFDERVHYTEDAKYIHDILFENPTYGILNTTFYLYRKRENEGSAIQTSTKRKTWYLDTPQHVYLYILKEAKEKFGEIPEYFQNLIAYDMQFRMKTCTLSALSKEEQEKYLNTLQKIYSYINDDIIFEQKHSYTEHKLLALSIKYGLSIEELYQQFEYEDGDIYLKDREIVPFHKNICKITNIRIHNNKAHFTGFVRTLFSVKEVDLFLYTNEEYQKVELKQLENFSIKALDRTIFPAYSFEFSINLKDDTIVQLRFSNNDFDLASYIEMYKGLKSNYLVINDHILKFNHRSFVIRDKNHFSLFKLESYYFFNLLKNKKLNVIWKRLLYRIGKIFKNKPLWVFIERPTKGGDNAQALFEYSTKQKDNIKKVFIIDKKSEDYEKIKKVGKVIPWKSFRHLLLFLRADKLISSHANDFIINPFGRLRKYYYDLYSFDYIFLQHGITKDDISSWLNRYDKDIRLFITAAKPEYKSILEYDYGYKKDEVLLSGFPRYDKLENKTKKKILIMPTWRHYLATPIDKDGLNVRNPNFITSKYFKFYNSLINNKRLIKKLQKTGYKIKLCLHPSSIPNADDFTQNPTVDISKTICNYAKEFKEGALLITDYSSVAFDFAYLRKPVIYSHFDADKFFSNHIYERGYFDYEKDAFGPVCYNLEETIAQTIKAIDRDFKLKNKYKYRINNFFEYKDKNNSKRVYDAILNLN